MTDPKGNIPEDRGAVLAIDMIKALSILNGSVCELNDTLRRSFEMKAELLEAIDQLTGYFEVVNRTVEIVAEKRDEGKNKWSHNDYIDAWLEAADEIMPHEDKEGEEEEDESGDEDPRVRRH